jgi:translation initiation factor IF-2
MAIKLIKACKELNIGMSTAVEFCSKQGHNIATDPNTRIDDELYLLLAKEFNKDMALKLEAERLAQERQEREIPPSLSIEPKPVVRAAAPEVQQPKIVGKIELEEERKARELAEKEAERKAEELRLAQEAARKAEEEAAKAAAEALEKEKKAQKEALAKQQEEQRKAQ